MPINPTRYEYTPPVQIAGKAKDFTSKIEISQGPNGWIATLNVASSPFENAGVASRRLREELIALAEELGGPVMK